MCRSVTNPVPEVAFPYVCAYFHTLLDMLLVPVDGATGAGHYYVAGQAGMPASLARRIEEGLYKKGLIYGRRRRERRGVSVWLQLSARGYLVALELERQRG